MINVFDYHFVIIKVYLNKDKQILVNHVVEVISGKNEDY